MRDHKLPIVRQCRILQIARSGVYRKPVQDRERNQDLKRLIKEIHSKHPDLGSRRMCDALRDRGHNIGRCAVRTLMRKMCPTSITFVHWRQLHLCMLIINSLVLILDQALRILLCHLPNLILVEGLFVL